MGTKVLKAKKKKKGDSCTFIDLYKHTCLVQWIRVPCPSFCTCIIFFLFSYSNLKLKWYEINCHKTNIYGKVWLKYITSTAFAAITDLKKERKKERKYEWNKERQPDKRPEACCLEIFGPSIVSLHVPLSHLHFLHAVASPFLCLFSGFWHPYTWRVHISAIQFFKYEIYMLLLFENSLIFN